MDMNNTIIIQLILILVMNVLPAILVIKYSSLPLMQKIALFFMALIFSWIGFLIGWFTLPMLNKSKSTNS